MRHLDAQSALFVHQNVFRVTRAMGKCFELFECRTISQACRDKSVKIQEDFWYFSFCFGGSCPCLDTLLKNAAIQQLAYYAFCFINRNDKRLEKCLHLNGNTLV